MAISFLELKRPDEAEASARRPRQARPQHAGAHNTMGEIFYARQNYRAALGHFLRAVALDPYTPSSTYNVAVTHERPGNTPEACHHRRRYIALEMRDAAAREAATRHVTTLAWGAG
jgi:tetratricopeptide (TPR) repeat protein